MTSLTRSWCNFRWSISVYQILFSCLSLLHWVDNVWFSDWIMSHFNFFAHNFHESTISGYGKRLRSQSIMLRSHIDIYQRSINLGHFFKLATGTITMIKGFFQNFALYLFKKELLIHEFQSTISKMHGMPVARFRVCW